MKHGISAWIEGSRTRIYPATLPNGSILDRARSVALPRNGFASCQLGVRNETDRPIRVEVEAAAPPQLQAHVRRIGYVTVAHHSTDTPMSFLEGLGSVPGLVPDPLFPEPSALIGPYETVGFWITVDAAHDAPVGESPIRLKVRADGHDARAFTLEARVSEIVSDSLADFPATHWFYADALCDYYDVPPCTPRFWTIVEPYMRNLSRHLSTCRYVPLFTPPTDGVKRPTQLLRVGADGAGRWSFDFTDVARWVQLARDTGARFFEWTHLFSQWGVERALRIYRSNEDETSLLWPPETPATSPVYRSFLEQFLPRFREFLEEQGLTTVSLFHVSDEPGAEHVDNYRAAREMLRELAPWMKVADALSHVEFAQMGLTDIPIVSIGAAEAFRDAGIPAWAYFCCGPRGSYLNRLLDTPLARIAMAGRLLHRHGAQGFLHWGYNYWYKSQSRMLLDPFVDQAGGAWPGWPPGDPFVVYPGQDGPLDSIRWEVWAEAMQELALLRALGIEPDHPGLASMRGYGDFDSHGQPDLLSPIFTDR